MHIAPRIYFLKFKLELLLRKNNFLASGGQKGRAKGGAKAAKQQQLTNGSGGVADGSGTVSSVPQQPTGQKRPHALVMPSTTTAPNHPTASQMVLPLSASASMSGGSGMMTMDHLSGSTIPSTYASSSYNGPAPPKTPNSADSVLCHNNNSYMYGSKRDTSTTDLMMRPPSTSSSAAAVMNSANVRTNGGGGGGGEAKRLRLDNPSLAGLSVKSEDDATKEMVPSASDNGNSPNCSSGAATLPGTAAAASAITTTASSASSSSSSLSEMHYAHFNGFSSNEVHIFFSDFFRGWGHFPQSLHGAIFCC